MSLKQLNNLLQRQSAKKVFFFLIWRHNRIRGAVQSYALYPDEKARASSSHSSLFRSRFGDNSNKNENLYSSISLYRVFTNYII